MNDDLTLFWRNNERASALFHDLLARAQRNAFDDEFLAQLAAYREADGSPVHADIFAAEYLLAHDDAAGALSAPSRRSGDSSGLCRARLSYKADSAGSLECACTCL